MVGIVDITLFCFSLAINVQHFGDKDRDAGVAHSKVDFIELRLEVLGANLHHLLTYHGPKDETTKVLNTGIAILDVGVFLLRHPKMCHFGGFEEVDKKVVKHYTLLGKLTLASSHKALVARDVKVHLASHHVSDCGTWSKWFIISTKEPA